MRLRAAYPINMDADMEGLWGGERRLIGRGAFLQSLFRGALGWHVPGRVYQSPTCSTIAIEETTLASYYTPCRSVAVPLPLPTSTHAFPSLSPRTYNTSKRQQLSHSASIYLLTTITLRNTPTSITAALEDTLRWSPQPSTPSLRDANCRGHHRLQWSNPSNNGSSQRMSFCTRPRYSTVCLQRKNAH
jgi:hypothetical protein